MARVEEPELHELIRFDVVDELRADPFPGRPPERKAVLDDPLAEGLAHDRPAVGKAVLCREALDVGRTRYRRDAIDHRAREADLVGNPAGEVARRIPQAGMRQHGLPQHRTIRLDVVAAQDGEWRQSGVAAAT